MGEVALYAVGIDELRELFTGSDAVASHLRELAAAAFPPPPPLRPRGNLLDRLGPFWRKPVGAPVIRAGIPNGHDLDDLVHGRDIAPERLSAAWALVWLWLADGAWGRHAWEIDEPRMDELDFDLSRAGVDAALGLRKLFNGQAAIPVKAPAGLVSGYVRPPHVAAMGRAWRAALGDLSDDNRAIAEPVADWLDGFSAWNAAAAGRGRPEPDLVAFYQA